MTNRKKGHAVGDRSARATLKDVAQKVGTHVSTVSRVMNPETRRLISPEVVQRVQAAAVELGYRPNIFAASLRTQRSHAIGVLITDVVNPAFPPLLLAIENVLNNHGYIPIVANTDSSPARQHQITESMISRQVDGVIFATSTDPTRVITECEAAGVPVVVVFRRGTPLLVPTVADNDRTGIRLATRHMLDLGHTRVAHVGGPPHLSTGKQRRDEFRRAIKAAGLPARPDWVVSAGRYSRAEGEAACLRLMGSADRPTAIVAANDLLAMGCYDALRKLGLRCPQDVSVSGYGDAPFADLLSPPLTTLHVYNDEIGRTAAEVLLALIASGTANAQQRVFEPDLIVRGSTAVPGAAGQAGVKPVAAKNAAARMPKRRPAI